MEIGKKFYIRTEKMSGKNCSIKTFMEAGTQRSIRISLGFSLDFTKDSKNCKIFCITGGPLRSGAKGLPWKERVDG